MIHKYSGNTSIFINLIFILNNIIISNVKHVHLFYIIIVYTPQLLFLNPGFILKTPLPLMLLLYLIHLTSSSHVPHA